MPPFVHLHTHSYYSLLDGVPSPEELLTAAKRAGMRALALTDHNGLYGAVEFYQLAKETGIKPIIGAQLDFEGDHSLVLLVKNESGYRNLCELITKGRQDGGHNKFHKRINRALRRTEGARLPSAETAQNGRGCKTGSFSAGFV